MTPVIGITGGIGAGKSTVARLLAELGCLVSDSDADARAALRDPAVLETLVGWWGNDILDDDGAIDRGAVARIVFNDVDQRRRLEGLTHPWIEARRRERFASAGPDVRALVIDAPLLIEAGLDAECDAIIHVDAPRETRLARVKERGWDEAELTRREQSQASLDEKRNRADHVLCNDGDLPALEAELNRLLDTITAEHRH